MALITFDEFTNKWLGKKADYDGAYGGQCVDLFRFYVKEVLGFPQPKLVIGARNFWYNYESDPNLYNYYEKIPNTPEAVPKKGDVMLWDAWDINGDGDYRDYGDNGFGHVSMFRKQLYNGINYFNSLDQNYPTKDLVTITRHNYLNPKVLGWLRPKSGGDNPMQCFGFDVTKKIPEDCIKQLGKYWNDDDMWIKHLWLSKDIALDSLGEEVQILYENYEDKVNSYNELEDRYDALDEIYDDRVGELIEQHNSEMAKLILGHKAEIKVLKEQHNQAIIEKDKEIENTKKNLGDKIIELRQQIELLKNDCLSGLLLGDFIKWVGYKLGIRPLPEDDSN